MEIEIDINNAIPVYEQIVMQIHSVIIKKLLPIKSSLPSIRQLAGELKINPGTVAKAYQILESSGIIITAGRKGTFVSENAVEMISEYKHKARLKKINETISFLHNHGLEKQEIKQLFLKELQDA